MAASALTLVLPQYIILKSNHTPYNYMDYYHEKGDEFYGYLGCGATEAVSPYAKFEVETTDESGVVHIRSCQNNKYWVRTKNTSISESGVEIYWITATAEKPENDQSKGSCTLFQLIAAAEAGTNAFRFIHVQSGCYLWLTSFGYVLASYSIHGNMALDIFTIIDWDSLVILPRYLAFKGDNGQYLCVRSIEGHPYLQFSTSDIGHSSAAFEKFTTPDGTLRFKSVSNNNFWRGQPTWIWADSSDTSNNNNATLFHPVKVDYQTIGLLNVGKNLFCKRLTSEGKTNCLASHIASITKEARLTVEEAVMTSNIYDVKYDLENSRIYDEKVLVVATKATANYTQEDNTSEVKLSFTNTRTSNWKTNVSLKLGMKATMNFGLPLIFEGQLELSGEIQAGVEFGETTTTTTLLEV